MRMSTQKIKLKYNLLTATSLNECRLCFQHLVLIAAIFAGFGRKQENASGVQSMPSINAKRPAAFVLFQQVNHQLERKKSQKLYFYLEKRGAFDVAEKCNASHDH